MNHTVSIIYMCFRNAGAFTLKGLLKTNYIT